MMLRTTLAFLLSLVALNLHAQETATISGRVTDFDNKPIDRCLVRLMYNDFSSAKDVYSDQDGYYRMEGVEKGKYLALYAIRPEEYPRQNAVPKEDMRLEFWAWNVVVDRDLTINPRYHKLELYATHVFRIERNGAAYFRPMSVTKAVSQPEEVFLDKAKQEKVADISVRPQYLDVRVYADDVPLTVYSVQAIEEFTGIPENPMLGYIVQFAPPTLAPTKPYIIFRIEATNREHNEKGENLYFYELEDYKKNLDAR